MGQRDMLSVAGGESGKWAGAAGGGPLAEGSAGPASGHPLKGKGRHQ